MVRGSAILKTGIFSGLHRTSAPLSGDGSSAGDIILISASSAVVNALTLIFRKQYVDQIVRGEKTATRRASRPLIKPERIYHLRVGYRAVPEQIRVHRVYLQRLGDMTPSDVIMEGFPSLEEFRRCWMDIYKSWDDDRQVWVIEFEYLGQDRKL